MGHGKKKKLPWEEVVGVWGWGGLSSFSHGRVSPCVFFLLFPFVIPMASNNVNLGFSRFKLLFWFQSVCIWAYGAFGTTRDALYGEANEAMAKHTTV